MQDRWEFWTDQSATATMEGSVGSDGVVTITIGGVPQVNNESDGWGIWKTQAKYGYTEKANASYIYEFEAWTFAGERRLRVQYYWDDDTQIELVTSTEITSQRKTYTIIGDSLPKGGERTLNFLCGDQLGTFYVKVLSITEIGGSGTNPGTNPGGANPFVGTWTYVDEGFRTTTYTFNANMSFVYTLEYEYRQDEFNFTDTGTYTVSGNTAIMTRTDGNKDGAIISGNSLYYCPLVFAKTGSGGTSANPLAGTIWEGDKYGEGWGDGIHTHYTQTFVNTSFVLSFEYEYNPEKNSANTGTYVVSGNTVFLQFPPYYDDWGDYQEGEEMSCILSGNTLFVWIQYDYPLTKQ